MKPYDFQLDAGNQDSFRGSETILVVEEDRKVRTQIREVLASCGYQVLTVPNGEAALFTCERRQEAIHLLLTDVVMPEMSGHELASRLSELRPEMKVLFMSGYTAAAIVHPEVIDKDSPSIQKPFTPDALALKVREVLGLANRCSS